MSALFSDRLIIILYLILLAVILIDGALLAGRL